jgi:uncharacterized protein YndB with AHSA1/START domain
MSSIEHIDPAFIAVAEGRTLVIVRTFEAPLALVWTAFSDAYHLSQWWGPKGFTNPVCELDFRPGGHWHNVMRGPDGAEYPVDAVFDEIVPPERIVYRNAPAKGTSWGDNPPPSFVRTLTFVEAKGLTTLTMRAEFASPSDLERAQRRSFIEGTRESYERLAELLKGEP